MANGVWSNPNHRRIGYTPYAGAQRCEPGGQMAKRVTARRAMDRRGAFPWRQRVLECLRAASAAVRRLAPRAGQRVVAGREAGYRPWDPDVIAVDTAAERAVIAALRRGGIRGTLLSEEAGEARMSGRSSR